MYFPDREHIIGHLPVVVNYAVTLTQNYHGKPPNYNAIIVKGAHNAKIALVLDRDSPANIMQSSMFVHANLTHSLNISKKPPSLDPDYSVANPKMNESSHANSFNKMTSTSSKGCEVISVGLVTLSPDDVREATKLVTTVLYFRPAEPVHLHIVASDLTRHIWSTLLSTWELTQGRFKSTE